MNRGVGFAEASVIQRRNWRYKTERCFPMKNQYKITKKEMLSWIKEWRLQGVSNIILFALWCISGAIGFGALFAITFLDVHWIFCFLFLLCLLLFVLYAPLFVLLNRYHRLSKAYGKNEWVRTTNFADDEIIVVDHTSITKFRYENIKKIKEKNTVIIIFFNNRLAIRLYKDTFIEGSWEECKQKINSMHK